MREEDGTMELGELFPKVLDFVGNDVLEIFGDTGSGKTTFAIELTKSALLHGKSVLYIDTERNIADLKEIEGADYVHIYRYDDLVKYIDELVESGKKYDVVILDSLGWLILGQFAKMNMKQRGEALLKAISITYSMKVYSGQHGSLVLILNQPISEMSGKHPDELPSFGDKHKFGCKEQWKTKVRLKKPSLTRTDLVVWKSRRAGKDMPIARMEIMGDDGEKYVEIKWLFDRV